MHPHKFGALANRISFQTGKFLGLATVIATETRNDDGTSRPGNARGGRLIRSAPEQLRKVSQHEQRIEELKGPIELPWTIDNHKSDRSKEKNLFQVKWKLAMSFRPESPGNDQGF